MTAVGGLFFPLAGRLGLPARSTVTTRVLQKAVWAGANNGSYPLAAQALRELSELELSPKQIRHLVEQVGQARLAERGAAVAQLRALPLPRRRAGSRASEPPSLAVISMDGGRYQRRENFRHAPTRQADQQHWRETKVGCLLSMASQVHVADPTPELPACFAHSPAVAELAKVAETPDFRSARGPADPPAETPDDRAYTPPELVSREVLASGQEAERFGWQLEARAWQLGFPASPRQAFVADGAQANWSIQRRHFPHATPIADLMHALSYAWSAAAVEDDACYQRWAQWIWQGQVGQVLAALAAPQQRLGLPPPDAEASDPRQRVHRALTYYTHNQPRMNYPEYRRQGLPLTSSHIESTVTQINQRVKGSEKFWCRDSGEAVLQLRADSLSDSQALTPFWQRWQAQQTGSNRYRSAA